MFFCSCIGLLYFYHLIFSYMGGAGHVGTFTFLDMHDVLVRMNIRAVNCRSLSYYSNVRTLLTGNPARKDLSLLRLRAHIFPLRIGTTKFIWLNSTTDNFLRPFRYLSTAMAHGMNGGECVHVASPCSHVIRYNPMSITYNYLKSLMVCYVSFDFRDVSSSFMLFTINYTPIIFIMQ